MFKDRVKETERYVRVQTGHCCRSKREITRRGKQNERVTHGEGEVNNRVCSPSSAVKQKADKLERITRLNHHWGIALWCNSNREGETEREGERAKEEDRQ